MRLGLVFIAAVLVATAGTMYGTAWRSEGEGAAGARELGALEALASPSGAATSGVRPDAGGGAPAARRDRTGGGAGGGEKVVFYQYVDDRGAVRLVQSLDEVPAAWRERAGRIEMDAPARPARAARVASATPSSFARAAAAAQAASEQVWRTREHDAEVTIYTTSWCGACRNAIAYLDERGVDYTQHDIEEDDDALREYREKLREARRRSGVPLIDVDGKLMQGFNARKLDALLSGRG